MPFTRNKDKRHKTATEFAQQQRIERDFVKIVSNLPLMGEPHEDTPGGKFIVTPEQAMRDYVWLVGLARAVRHG
jgi:hypothetical protein